MNATEITSYSAFKVADEPETVLITLILLGQGHPVVATAAECWLKLDTEEEEGSRDGCDHNNLCHSFRVHRRRSLDPQLSSSNTNSIIIIIIAHHHLGDTNMTYSYTTAAAASAEDACPDEMMRQRWDRNAISRKHCQDAV